MAQRRASRKQRSRAAKAASSRTAAKVAPGTGQAVPDEPANPTSTPAETPADAPPRPESSADFMARGYARGRAKDAEARAKLVPLAPGERPGPVTVAFWVSVVLAVANLVAFVIGFDPDKGPQNGFTVLGTVVLAVMAYGMWHARYWAVLGMQALLGITMLFACVALITAANLAALALTVVIIGASGALFWFLVKSMARIQMPQRPDSRPLR